ncbi:MAG: hypothetical protein VXW15_06610 [Bdellovibrionota bacterium]|nr:hypothetical protein [Bdellovibrionota bacterium]
MSSGKKKAPLKELIKSSMMEEKRLSFEPQLLIYVDNDIFIML